MRLHPENSNTRKLIYSYEEQKEGNTETVQLEINLDYQYTYDDILLIWDARKNLLLRWIEQQKVPKENIRPIVRPDYEISYQAKTGEAGSLSKYLKDEHRDAAQGTKDDKSRLILIPLNTGGHWVTLILYIHGDNTLDSVAYIDSLYKEQEVSEEPYLGVLSEDHLLVKEIIKAYPGFNKKIHSFMHYVQMDKIACGVLGIENAMAFIKWAYTKSMTGFALKPGLCDDKLMADLRGLHLRLIGGKSNPLYETQRNNVIDVLDAETQFLILDHLDRETILENEAEAIVTLISQLFPEQQKTLRAAFLPQKGEDHMPHLMRIRVALSDIYREFTDIDDESSQKVAYTLLLDSLFGLPFEAFKEKGAFTDTSSMGFKKPFKEPMNDYEQLIAVGNLLGPLVRPFPFQWSTEPETDYLSSYSTSGNPYGFNYGSFSNSSHTPKSSSGSSRKFLLTSEENTAGNKKILLLGAEKSGKTAFLRRLDSNNFSSEYTKTSMTSFFQKPKFRLWDTPGAKDLQSSSLECVTGSNLVVLVIDLSCIGTSIQYFKNMPKKDLTFTEEMKCVVVFTKADLVINAMPSEDTLQVYAIEAFNAIGVSGDNFADSNYLVTSAKEGKGIQEAFQEWKGFLDPASTDQFSL